MTNRWLDRERRTARMVRACYAHYLKGRKASPAQMHALCQLTWITKANGEPTVGTAAVTAPALSTLTGARLAAESPAELALQLEQADAPPDIVAAADSGAVGLVNFYSAFRGTSLDWIREHRTTVWALIEGAAAAEHDEEVLALYERLQNVPPLPRPGAGDLPAFNLLTPVLACLDHRRRTPVINSRDAVRRRLRMLGLRNETLAEQCSGLVGLIGQAGIDDAFALDVTSDEVVLSAIEQGSRRRAMGRSASAHATVQRAKPLSEKNDSDVEFLRSVDLVSMRRVHHRLTNALRAWGRKRQLEIEEGFADDCMFDAVIRSYAGTERHLLIEVKSESSPPYCRMAVGQLLDYRRRMPDAAMMDLAVLFSSAPPREMRAFLGSVGVHTLWFDEDMAILEGMSSLEQGKPGGR